MSTAQNPEQLRAEIEQTRADLGQTVEALAAKTDVTARAKEAAADAAGRAKTKLDDARHIATDRLAPAKERTLALKERAAHDPAVRRSLLPAAGVAAMAVVGVILVVASRRKR